MTAMVWFRNDLRIHAHSPLRAAQQSGQNVVAVYCLCNQQWDAHSVAPSRRRYVLESLQQLSAALAQQGIVLHVLEANDFAAVPSLLAAFVQTHAVSELYFNCEYPLNEQRRDRAVRQTLSPLGVRITTYEDGVLVPVDALKTGKGTPYAVFGAYKRRWLSWMEEFAVPAQAEPERHASPTQEHPPSVELIRRALVDLPESESHQPAAGEVAAQDALEMFTASPLARYHDGRDQPAVAGTSALSTALSAGTLAPLSAWRMAKSAAEDPAFRQGQESWVTELIWRDFYRQLIAHYPRLSQGRAFKPATDALQWDDNPALFEAWCTGRTGYPFVDAGMRQLVQTGWMHNRLRMVTAMFLCKNLWLDWRQGEQFFMQQLVDGDYAANNGGWQWCASTGTDSVPYFRVFNPVRQGQRFDPQGEYIARWVPELASLPAKWRHTPWLSPHTIDYPEPIVPLEGTKERVVAAFKSLPVVAS